MEKGKSNNLVISIVCAVLTVFGIVVSVIAMRNGSDGLLVRAAQYVINILLSFLIVFYAVYGYKKPHGNALKYIILLFAIPMLLSVYTYALRGMAGQAVIRAIVIGLICFAAGRLHKFKQVVTIMSIVAALIVVFIITTLVNGSSTIGIFNVLVIWIDIFVAYALRYKGHKEAGLMDKEEK